MSRITVIRTDYTPESTTGVMLLNGDPFGRTLEDCLRETKLQGRTAIPAGRYGVCLTHSPRFGCMLPLILQVPGFSGVRIHGGNTAADTEGCILVAQHRQTRDRIAGSLSKALVALLAQEGGPHEIEILNAWRGAGVV